MHKYRVHFIFAACLAVVVALVTWLLVSPDSPIESSSAAVLNVLGLVHIVPSIVATILSGNVHGGSNMVYWLLVVAQWFVFGFVLALLLQSLRRHNDAA
jgi:hypothetical protein